MIDCRIRVGRCADSSTPSPLDGSDVARAQRFRRPEDRRRFVLGRTLARSLAADVVGAAATEIRIGLRCRTCGSGEHGKPTAFHPRGSVPISISHSGDLVVVAATTGPEVGVDVEGVDRDLDIVRLVGDVAAASEAESVSDVSDFYRLWTGKEAVLKCTGHGLMVPMTRITLGAIRDGRERATWTDDGGFVASVVPLDLGPGYVGSVALALDRAVEIVVE